MALMSHGKAREDDQGGANTHSFPSIKARLLVSSRPPSMPGMLYYKRNKGNYFTSGSPAHRKQVSALQHNSEIRV